MKKILKIALVALLLTGCISESESVKPEKISVDHLYTEVCLNGIVYYVRGRGISKALAPKLNHRGHGYPCITKKETN